MGLSPRSVLLSLLAGVVGLSVWLHVDQRPSRTVRPFFAGDVRLKAVPSLVATCPNGIAVRAHEGGPVEINGGAAIIKVFNAAYFEARSAGITVAVSKVGDSYQVAYSVTGGENGQCRILDGDLPGPAATSSRDAPSWPDERAR